MTVPFERFERIKRAEIAALAKRFDPESADILDLLRDIRAAVPDASAEEIAETLGWGSTVADRRAEQRIIARLERDLEIARRAVPDLEAARKVARDLAVINNLELMLGLAQAEWQASYESPR
jgi:hypothetical protein